MTGDKALRKTITVEIKPMDEMTYQRYAFLWRSRAQTWFEYHQKFPLQTHGFMCKYENAEDWTLVVLGVAEDLERIKGAIEIHNDCVMNHCQATSRKEFVEDPELYKLALRVIGYLQ